MGIILKLLLDATLNIVLISNNNCTFYINIVTFHSAGEADLAYFFIF
jgi:hypothetical protein